MAKAEIPERMSQGKVVSRSKRPQREGIAEEGQVGPHTWTTSWALEVLKGYTAFFCGSMCSRKELCDHHPLLVAFASHLRSPAIETGFDG